MTFKLEVSKDFSPYIASQEPARSATSGSCFAQIIASSVCFKHN